MRDISSTGRLVGPNVEIGSIACHQSISTEDMSLLSAKNALPHNLCELVRVLGFANALRLVGSHGGARISVPHQAHATHPFHAVLGPDTFEKLVAEYAGEAIDLPKSDVYLRILRHEQVKQCRASGMTVDQTAKATGYSRRHVINIMGGERTPTTFNQSLTQQEQDTEAHASPISAHAPFRLRNDS